MELTGKVIAIQPARTGTSQRGDWKSQEYVMEYSEGGQYPRKLAFTVFGAEKIDKYNIQVGQTLTVSFDIDAREWNGKWFSDIRAWDVRPAGAQPQAQQPAPQQAAQPQQPAAMQSKEEAPADDVPF